MQCTVRDVKLLRCVIDSMIRKLFETNGLYGSPAEVAAAGGARVSHDLGLASGGDGEGNIPLGIGASDSRCGVILVRVLNRASPIA